MAYRFLLLLGLVVLVVKVECNPGRQLLQSACPIFDDTQDCMPEGDQVYARRFGARLANLDQWPYLVSLQRPYSSCFINFCQGVLIAPNMVLTAAHCLEFYRYLEDESGFPDNFIYVTRSAQCSSQEGVGGRVQPQRLFLHPDWDQSAYSNDLAIIVLRENLLEESDNFINYREARVPSIYSRLLQSTQVVGYRLSGGPRATRDVTQNPEEFVVPLLEATLSLVPEGHCKDLLSGFSESEFAASLLSYDTMVCAFSARTDTCAGDSGTPLIYKQDDGSDIVIGIASWGPSTQCDPQDPIEAPAIFTRVGNYVYWIDQLLVEYSSGIIPDELLDEQPLLLSDPPVVDCDERFVRSCTMFVQRECCTSLEGVRVQDRCYQGNNEYTYSGICNNAGQIYLQNSKSSLRDCICQ
eukprot:TRINITY_DN39628_c1_g1_i1.p1 TRINITY_DN39628_c1_g1~~TRINITY_DN39628_c1_g1_i1.p1  ORF type:complete len:410 (+),score=28.08 TRINITY_DN39628_c1_g1_i1:118-1347(+)